jgi:hypothetical protein
MKVIRNGPMFADPVPYPEGQEFCSDPVTLANYLKYTLQADSVDCTNNGRIGHKTDEWGVFLGEMPNEV